jgi:hypothetical protein
VFWVIALIVTIVVIIPVAVLMTAGAVAALLGWSLKEEGEEGANQELVELS